MTYACCLRAPANTYAVECTTQPVNSVTCQRCVLTKQMS